MSTPERVPEVRAPRQGEFFRVHPDEKMRDEVFLTRDENGKLYFIAPHLVARLPPDKVDRCMMFVAVNADGQEFLWPVNQPVPADHPAYQAMTEWICLRGMQ